MFGIKKQNLGVKKTKYSCKKLPNFAYCLSNFGEPWAKMAKFGLTRKARNVASIPTVA